MNTHNDRHIVTGSIVGDELYAFRQLHFHWNKRERSGTEHSINGERFALEVHYVNEKVHHDDQRNQLVVLSSLFKVIFLFCFLFFAILSSFIFNFLLLDLNLKNRKEDIIHFLTIWLSPFRVSLTRMTMWPWSYVIKAKALPMVCPQTQIASTRTTVP